MVIVVAISGRVSWRLPVEEAIDMILRNEVSWVWRHIHLSCVSTSRYSSWSSFPSPVLRHRHSYCGISTLSSSLLFGGQIASATGHCVTCLIVRFQHETLRVSSPNFPNLNTSWDEWMIVDKPTFPSFLAWRSLRPFGTFPHHSPSIGVLHR